MASDAAWNVRGPAPSDRSAASELESRIAAVDRALAVLNRQSDVSCRHCPADWWASESNPVPSLEHQLRQLIAQLEALRGPGSFQQALAALRSELADISRKLTEAAPRRALQALEAEVHTLVDRVDAGRHLGGDATTLANIERALVEVRDALQQLAPAESLASFRQDAQALDHKLDQRFAQLAAALETRVAASAPANTAHLIAIVEALAEKVERVEGLKQDLGALRQGQVQNAHLTQDALEAVQVTLERLFDRLDMVQTDIGARASSAALPTRGPEASPHLSGSPHQPETRRPFAPAVAAAPPMTMPQVRRPIDPTLPADHPLEPGTARPRPRSSTTPPSPAERVAASEAALVAANPAGEPDSKANFIAAARRAAQAAATLAPPASRALSEENRSSISTFAAIAQKLTRRGPPILGAAILLIAGALNAEGIDGTRDFKIAAHWPQPEDATSVKPPAVGWDAAAPVPSCELSGGCPFGPDRER
jgi:localization factor PodJL